MDKRFATFLTLSLLLVTVNFTIMWWWQKNHPLPPPQAAQPAKVAQKQAEKKPVAKKAAPAERKQEPQPEKKPAAEVAERKEPVQVWKTLGSADADGSYRMLATVTNRGAAVVRIELNSPRFHDLEDRSGYLGHLEGAKAANNKGCLVRVVGAGTPAAQAGLESGDIITSIASRKVTGPKHLSEVLSQHEPKEVVELTIERKGQKKTLSATLGRRPLEVIRPEPENISDELRDPLSFLLTLEQVGKDKLADDAQELPGLKLRNSNWTVRESDPQKPDEVAFEYALQKYGLRVIKTYGIARLAANDKDDLHAPAYHLTMRIEIVNTGKKAKDVAYRLDGPTGLPIEGWWYSMSTKIGRDGSPGVRDMVVLYRQGEKQQATFRQVNALRLAEDDLPPAYEDVSLVYAGVDAQYVAAALIPRPQGDVYPQFAKVVPLRVGPVPADKNRKKLVDTSCRLISQAAAIKPDESLAQEFQIFAGPKRPDLLAKYAAPYGLGDLVYYGMFGWVSQPMLKVLHFFYGIVGNYGLAIVMLTVLVRSCMFPLSRKQALTAAKMQELQPELKKLADKYKNPEERMKAQREFFRKHNYHPLSGCLPALIQLPIFLGLYRSLALDIELRQAPLISESIRWCSNLGAPDMLWYWRPYVPIDILTDVSAGYLGPYLNLLPLVTVTLFIVQQKILMPPPTDEQSALQQKMMQYMMIIMGVMFFKVASGLCIYFIASSLWGIAERKLLPKPVRKSGDNAAKLPPPPGPNGSGAASRKKQRPRK